jgi:hypothetical protein
VAPIFEQLSQSLSRPDVVSFVKIDADARKDVAQAYLVLNVPAFIIFRNGSIIEKVQGANPVKLQQVVKKLMTEIDKLEADGDGSGEANGSGSNGSSSNWRGAALPRGYNDVTGQIELQRCELLNYDTELGGVRVLFDSAKPSALSGGKETAKDWVESDTDEQLMLFMPFQSMLKLHTLQVRRDTNLPNRADKVDSAGWLLILRYPDYVFTPKQ